MNLSEQLKRDGNCFRSPRPKKKGKGIRRAKPERAIDLKQYSKRRLVFLRVNHACEAFIEGCSGAATDVHHRKGRIGKLLLDEKYWLPCCRSCHTYIHNNPSEARQRGLLV